MIYRKTNGTCRSSNDKMIIEENRWIPIGQGIPAIRARPASEAKGVVLIFHGLSAHKGHQWPEIKRLAHAGFIGVAIDSVCHGERYDPFLDKVLNDWNDNQSAFRDLMAAAVSEIPSILEYLQETEKLPVAVSGISMGGHMAFCSLLCQPVPSVCVPLLASTHIPVPSAGNRTPEDAIDVIPTIPLLVVTAGKDDVVPPGKATEFVEKLRPRYGSDQDKIKSLQFPESAHMMREQDWNSAWDEITNWFSRWLG